MFEIYRGQIDVSLKDEVRSNGGRRREGPTLFISSGRVSQPTESKDACSFHRGREDESGDDAATWTMWKIVGALLGTFCRISNN